MTKKIILTLPVLLLLSFSASKKRSFIPPGTVQITETFFADETEISNFSWNEYEFWTKIKYGAYSPQHLAALPDTLVWRDTSAYNEPYTKYYYRHPAYKNYPVVGISYEQALAFCKWRTERVKEFYSIRYKKELQIEYRLPGKAEWELISLSALGNGKNKKGEMMLNCVSEPDPSDTLTYAGMADVTTPVYSYRKNSFGLFNAFGNVAEMVAEKGICKGGSWRHRLEECRSGKEVSYQKAEAWLGFRCVCSMGK
jgi:formylglycine-generating enzyme required for sulfatase activity